MTHHDQDPDKPKPLPMKAITIGTGLLFVIIALFALVLPAFFDSSPFGKLFKEQRPGSDSEASMRLSDTQLAGREHFLQYCANCHGPEGRGNGPSAVSLRKRPPSFIAPNVVTKNGLDRSGVLKTLNEGLPNSEMPSFEKLPDEVKNLMAEYIDFLHTNPNLF